MTGAGLLVHAAEVAGPVGPVSVDDDLWSKEYLLAAEKSYRAQDKASRYLQQLRQIVEDLSVYPTGQSLKEVFWRSLIQDDAQKEPARLGACLDIMIEHLGRSEDVAVENIPTYRMHAGGKTMLGGQQINDESIGRAASHSRLVWWV